MLEHLDGTTRVFPILGDPIAQVKAPRGLTQRMERDGRNGVVVPLRVAPDGLEALVEALGRSDSVGGLVVTVPHKFAVLRHCASVTEQARFTGAVNVMRRTPAGWHGAMLDGDAFVAAQAAAGGPQRGRRALLCGAGGAGGAIALALLEAGVARLAVHDAAPARRDTLLARLAPRFGDAVMPGGDDPAGFDLVCNATPSGMRPDDAPPVRLDRLAPGMVVGDVVTAPEVTPLLAAARALGCATSTGIGMFEAQADLLVDFLWGS